MSHKNSKIGQIPQKIVSPFYQDAACTQQVKSHLGQLGQVTFVDVSGQHLDGHPDEPADYLPLSRKISWIVLQDFVAVQNH